MASWDITGNSGTNPNDNFLGTADNEPLVIRTNNTERLRVDANGNVGIGTTSPTETLTVNGNSIVGKAQSSADSTFVSVYDEGSGWVGFAKRGTAVAGNMGLGLNDSEIVSTSGNLGVFTYTTGYLALGTNNTERLRVDTNGNVGIGTTSPNYLLHVVNPNGTAITGSSPTNAGVVGFGSSNGVAGFSTTSAGVSGTSNSGAGVEGFSRSAPGVTGTSETGAGIVGWARANNFGTTHPSNPGTAGVYGESLDTALGVGVWGKSYNSGVMAFNFGNQNAAYLASGCCAAYLVGEVAIIGHLSKSSGGFLIDHPLDPADKYLSHSFVESPDMKNIYDGVVVMDVNGEAMIELPAWFEAINTDFRYQLTCIGGYAPVYIAREVLDNRFKIAGGTPSMRVSWQVTGIRQDAWANAHRVRVEEEKSIEERGNYLHPELHGAPNEKSIERVRHPIPQRAQQTP